jgi:hypothetical protein
MWYDAKQRGIAKAKKKTVRVKEASNQFVKMKKTSSKAKKKQRARSIIKEDLPPPKPRQTQPRPEGLKVDSMRSDARMQKRIKATVNAMERSFACSCNLTENQHIFKHYAARRTRELEASLDSIGQQFADMSCKVEQDLEKETDEDCMRIHLGMHVSLRGLGLRRRKPAQLTHAIALTKPAQALVQEVGSYVCA